MRKACAFAASGGLLAILVVAPAHAQSSLPDRSLMFNPNSVQQQNTAPDRRQPAAVQTPATKRTDRKAAQPAAQPKRDTPRTALPRVTEKDPPQVIQPTLGRIPFETGSIGFSTDTKFKTLEMPDGRRTPGFENVQRRDSSYFGLSLSVPTDKTSIPLPPLFARPD